MANTGNTQQQINYGAAANDGQGDPLRTAFIKTDDNFDNVWLAGPVGSNITIGNNTIQSNNTNGNIILKPNGIGVIQANASVIPNADGVRDLGTANLAWRRAYISELLPENLTVSGDAVIEGNLTVEGDTIQIGNITTDTLTIQLANTAANTAAANGAGITVGANDDIATILYNSTANRWNVSVGISAVGNILAPYFSGNGSLLTGMYGNANVVANLAAFANNSISTTGNISAGRLTANSAGNVWNFNTDTLSFPSGASWRSDRFTLDEYISSAVDGYLNLQTFDNTSNVATELHMEHGIVQFNIYNGTLKTWNFNDNGSTTFPGDLLPSANLGGNLGNSSLYWSNLWVANNTIYIGGVPLGMTSGNVLTVNGNAVLSNNSSTAISTTGNITSGNVLTGGRVSATGNVTGNYILGDGSGLTNLPAPAVTQDITSNGAMSIMLYDGVIKYNNYATVEPSSGNITGGNVLTSGLISASGNITGNYILGNGSQLTGLPATYGNANVATFLADYGSNTISTTGNVTAGNFLGSGANVDIVAGSYDWTFDNAGNLTLPGNTFAVNYANGTAVSLGGNYGNANVATFLGTFGSNSISTTGNVTAGNLITTANVLANGYARLTGSFDESQASTAGLYLGYAGGTARIMFGTGNTSQTIEIDNDGGTLRFYKPGTTLASLTNSGDFSVTGNISGNTAGFSIGYRDIPQVTFSANATAALADAGKHYYSTTAGNLALTLPDNSNVAFATGTALTIVVNAAGNVLVNQGTGVSLYQAGSATTGNRVVGAYGLATVMKVAANTWVINGTGVY